MDPWTKPKQGRTECGRWGWVGQGKVVMEKWRQLYSNTNKKKRRKEKTQTEMKVTLSEIKKNLHGTNSGGDEAKNQINDLGYKEEISI